jgi:2-polyprenyl-6-methoxyphenol hydroxylase-like FAD-dependent oxidoreductase
MPREPYQRCSQAIFEAWLKPHIMAQPLITTQFGMKFESLVETEDNVISTFTTQSGERHTVTSQYVLGCDGAGSKVRKSIGITLTGGPV